MRLILTVLLLTSAFSSAGLAQEAATRLYQHCLSSSITAATLSADGNMLAIAARDKSIQLLDASTGKLIKKLGPGKSPADTLAFNSSGSRLVSAGYNEILIWDVAAGNLLKPLRGAVGRISSATWNPSDTHFATAGSDKTIRLIDATTFKQTSSFKAGSISIKKLLYSTDGSSLISASNNKLLKWDPTTGKSLATLSAHRSAILAIAWQQDGKTLVSGGTDKKLMRWDLTKTSPITTVDDAGGQILGLDAATSSPYMVTALSDRSLVIHDAKGKGLHKIMDMKKAATHVMMSSDGTRVFATAKSPGDTLFAWTIDHSSIDKGLGIMGGSVATKADYLTRAEQAVIEEMNLARTDPKQYATFAEDHLKSFQDESTYIRQGSNMRIGTQEGTKLVKETIAFLNSVKPVGKLVPKKGLSLAAKDHSADQAETGVTGHTGKDGSSPFDRMKRYGSYSGAGENIAYGPSVARQIVLQLIIDDGVPSRGHRTNIYKSTFTSSGVSIGPHKTYREMCVITYGTGYKDK